MRKLLILFTAIFTILTATAQVEHSIILDQNSFRKVNADALTGVNVDPIRKDSSRNACARVKIQFANMSRAEVDALVLQFRSNTDLVRQEIGYYDNVLILEMTAKPSTRFYVQSPDYGQSNEVTLNLEGNCEYEMEARLNQSFSIAVSTNIEGAEVYIDGRMKGRTGSNLSLTIKDVMIGSHTLKLVYGSTQAEQRIEVSGNSIIFRQDLNVDIERFDVTFKIQPATASITIDNGVELPITDGTFILKLPKGTHRYIIKADKHHPQSGEFDVVDSSKEVSVSLKVDGAMVSLTAPNNAEIWINEQKMSNGTWSGFLYSGLYTFESCKEGYRNSRLSQRITSATASQSYTLPAPEPIYGSIMVDGTPLTADVILDGKHIGTLPLKLGNILVGNHTLTISKKGYADYTQVITISEGKTTTVSPTLTKQQISVPATNTTTAPKSALASDSYNIGDLVTINGVQGIVFQTSPVVKIVSVKETTATWGEYGVATNARDKDNGKANMDKIKSIPGWQTKYPAFKWCADLGDGWYLPTINELKAIYTQRYAVNKTLSINKMNRLGTKHEYDCFWSSSEERRSNKAYYIYFTGLSTQEYYVSSYHYDKYDDLNVRAVYVLDTVNTNSTPHTKTIPNFDMVYVKGGTFTMGATAEQVSDADEKPTHSVTVSDFYIGKYEVTQAQWEAIMGSNPSALKNDNLPVENISWKDIHKFIKKLNAKTGKKFRLPTEAEWEYAARGGNQSKGYKYSGSNNISEVAWYKDNSNRETHPVGQKSPNELGIYVMSGNVYEWCQDWYGNYSSEAQTNPTGPRRGSYRVRRGGSWDSYASDCRVSNRYDSRPDRRSDHIGFRLACSSE